MLAMYYVISCSRRPYWDPEEQEADYILTTILLSLSDATLVLFPNHITSKPSVVHIALKLSCKLGKLWSWLYHTAAASAAQTHSNSSLWAERLSLTCQANRTLIQSKYCSTFWFCWFAPFLILKNYIHSWWNTKWDILGAFQTLWNILNIFAAICKNLFRFW